KEDIQLVHVTSTRMLMQAGFMARLFDVLGRNKVVIGMIATSEVTVSLTTDTVAGLPQAVDEITRENVARVKVETGKAVMCVVGRGMRHSIGTAARVFSAVSKAGVNIQMISQGASEINISFVVNNEDIPKTVQALHEELFGK
ncbi:MAG TPA: ACT domain-containing protein, partial [Planctomycetes bacterium]|nr:ACT domain-containing protein [Planctomycetota bacterium]